MIIFEEDELRKQNENVSLEDADSIIKQLEQTLNLYPGVGLAAPQIGIHKRVAIIRYGENKLNLINPVIVEYSKEIISKGEGCLSFPNKTINVWRYGEIFVKDDLHPDGIVLTDTLAIIASHEIDHLNGILFIEKEVSKKTGRNDPCPCGRQNNGGFIKFKNCHGG